MFKGTVSTATGLLAIAMLAACGAGAPRSGAGLSPSPDSTFTPIPSATSQPTPTSALDPAGGAIAGHVTTPSEIIEPQLVYAISTDNTSQKAFSTETIFNQSEYTIKGVTPGTYYVYAANRPLHSPSGAKVLGALYSSAVPCGLAVGCDNHGALKVAVRAGATTTGIDPIDWYTPDGLVAAPPAVVVPDDPLLQPSAPAYSSARDAATGIQRSIHPELFVDSLTACPANRACFWVGEEHDGTGAAYFVGGGGSNGNWIGCGTYVYRDSAGWKGFRFSFCSPTIFPAVGATGHVFIGLGATGCINVRKAPAGAVTGCVEVDASVKVDGGPVYAPLKGSDGVWWHIAGRGWMADDFLR